MRQHKKFPRILSMLLVVATLFSLFTVPANAASLKDSGSLQVVKTGPGGAPLEGAECTLTGDQGTTVTGTSDRNGQVILDRSGPC